MGVSEREEHRAGRLVARPREGRPAAGFQPGCRRLGLSAHRDGAICLPARAAPGARLPLLVLFHGAGGDVRGAAALMRLLSELLGAAVLAPESRGRTWERIRDGFGPDVAFIDVALAQLFASAPIDPRRIAVGGFSDGASYALSVALTNGDLFGQALAFAPGFMAPGEPRGRPEFFIVHGTRDAVLPIDRCSRRIVPALQGAGYDVTYHEFTGGHVVSPRLVRRAVRWLRSRPAWARQPA
jgi:predicted esterase